jgi:uncharacterized phage protein (TIGR02218 family)
MRTISVDLQADIEQGCTSLARLWKITRADDEIIYLTESDAPIVFDGNTYRADIGFTPSSILTTADFASAQSVTILVAMTDDGIAEDDLRMKRYEGASGELSIINYLEPTHGVMKVYTGNFGRVELGRGVANIELLPLGSSMTKAVIGAEVYAPTCRNSFGDVNCEGVEHTVDLSALQVSFTVDTISTNVVTASEFTAADNQYAQGYILWETGDNAGVHSLVARSELSTHTVTLSVLPPKAIQIGDTGTAFPGCDKVLDTCITRWNNIKNFRGEPNVPDTTFLPLTSIGAAPEGGS